LQSGCGRQIPSARFPADAQYRGWSIRFHIIAMIAINAAFSGGESSPTNIAKYK
jgi:hypothetical protein